MKHARTWVVFAILLALMLGVVAWIYPQLPLRAATHWNARGEVNGWMPRFWAAAIWPLAMLASMGAFSVLPAISPRRYEIRPFGRAYGIVVLAFEGMLLVTGSLALFGAAGYDVAIATVVPLAVGVLLVVLGNYMGKFRKNFFIGIRTPWTLASDAVWERTHRLGGWVFVVGGVVLVLVGLARLPAFVVVADVVALVLVPTIYSYVVYRRLDGAGRTGGDAT